MGHHCCSKQKVKRGLWSPEEDEKLIKCITTHGHGCWSSVPKLAGLQRCGKSCRLRWINYLRPDLRRGSFSTQEERIIIDVHRILGNRWAQIAKHLPGRTDNEVKNFWNSCIKKKLIAQGLDPKTHNLMISSSHHHKTPNSNNACNLNQFYQQPTQVFSINSHLGDVSSIDINSSFTTLPPTNTVMQQPPLFHGSMNIPTTTYNDQNMHALIDFSGGRCSIESAPAAVSSSFPITTTSGFDFIEENCIWAGGSNAEFFEPPKQEEDIGKDQKVCGVEFNESINNEVKEGQTSFNGCSDFDLEFMDSSSFIPCGGIYSNMISPMEEQLAWDC